ncbi:PKD domain containing protein [Nitzschia inconspicua]|uniref:PKD domain containing protein n=1 Tax=Nitzschia inconspicua TaxID=303405 RepID=A0A9K3K8T4_9STRA|nr:PKD domain containing protein [Nitzschia inconspicua]KAG7347563.1 PKD domain containing protein [Nitzschia inconspicua]
MAVADVLTAGFIKEFVANTPAVSGTWAPNPRRDGKPMILLSSKSGTIYVLEDPDESSATVTILNLGDADICTNGERGLQTAIPHPNFQDNRLLYVFYTKFQEGCSEDPTSGAYNVVARYRMDPVTLKLGNREEVWRGAPTTKRVHNGGAMLFGVDGKLYISTGDGGESRNSQMLHNTHGSIIRLNDDGSVPDDNPFSTQNGFNSVRCADTNGVTAEGSVCSEVYANGFRNPFRLAPDVNERGKVKFTVSDVGGNHWEELNTVGTDFAGRNYGFPIHEGVCSHGSETRCAPPTDSNIVEPFHWYAHKSTDDGGCVSGSVHVPNDLKWPSKYKFFFAEFVFREIYNLVEDPEGGCRSCQPPTSAYRNETFFRIENSDPNQERMTDIFFAPYKNTQALYIITRGGAQAVSRIRYTELVDNAPPVPVIVMPEQTGFFSINDELQFVGTESIDPDGDDLTYFWEFGDGETSKEPNPTHSFAAAGEYTITLTVTDTKDQEQQISETITIGEPPKVSILSPAEDEEFFVGQVFKLRGVAFDHRGNALPDEQLTWEVRQHHANHFHPFLDPTTGNNIELFGAPAPEDFYASTNSYLRIILTASDLDGLTTEVELLVQPQKINVTIDSDPSGVEILVENYAVMTPREIVSWQSHQLNVLASDVPPYQFRAWSDGETSRERTVNITQNNQQILALYCAQDRWFCSSADECCGGYCVANSCQADPNSQNHGWPVKPTAGVAGTENSEDADTPASSSSQPENVEQQIDGQSNSSPLGTQAPLGKQGIIIVVVLALIVVASIFLGIFIQKRRRRLEVEKNRYVVGGKSFNRHGQSVGKKTELPLDTPALSMAAIAIDSSPSKPSNSRTVDTAIDTGSSSSSATSTNGEDDAQERVSLEVDSKTSDSDNDLLDLESGSPKTEIILEEAVSSEEETYVGGMVHDTKAILIPAPPSPPSSISNIEN